MSNEEMVGWIAALEVIAMPLACIWSTFGTTLTTKVWRPACHYAGCP